MELIGTLRFTASLAVREIFFAGAEEMHVTESRE
jgi:hypothetical protein